MNKLKLFSLAGLGLLCACASAPLAVAPCAGYCHTHEEGYDWARRAVLEDKTACDAYPTDFARGCRDAVADYTGALSPRKEEF